MGPSRLICLGGLVGGVQGCHAVVPRQEHAAAAHRARLRGLAHLPPHGARVCQQEQVRRGRQLEEESGWI